MSWVSISPWRCNCRCDDASKKELHLRLVTFSLPRVGPLSLVALRELLTNSQQPQKLRIHNGESDEPCFQMQVPAILALTWRARFYARRPTTLPGRWLDSLELEESSASSGRGPSHPSPVVWSYRLSTATECVPPLVVL